MLTNAPLITVLPATDLERAKKFYTEKLGLTLSGRQERGGVTFTAGNTRLFIYERPAVTIQHTQASFEVPDVAKEVEELRSRGVVFEDYDMPGLKTENGIATMDDGYQSAWFKDTEGNILAIGSEVKK